MAEFLIIGGGVAGSALAIMLGRLGRTVELFERGRFPREKPCGEGLMPAGVAVMERLGLRGLAGGVAFEGIRYHRGGRSVEARFPTVAGLPNYGVARRRYSLDQEFFEAAAATTGVRAYCESSLDTLLYDGGRVSGAIIDGRAHRAKLVIGADGANSRVRSLLGWHIRPTRKRVGARAHFRLPAGRNPARLVNVFLLNGCELYVTPLPDGEVGVAALADAEAIDGRLTAAFGKWRRSPRELANYLDGATQTTELMARSPLGSGSRHGSGPGIVLLGDAAGATDPITGGGMAQALLSAALLTRHLSCSEASDRRWLTAFEGERRMLLRDYRRVTRMVLWLSRHPRAAQLSFHLAERLPSLLSHLIGTSGGLRPLVGYRGVTETLLPEILRDTTGVTPTPRGLPEFQR